MEIYPHQPTAFCVQNYRRMWSIFHPQQWIHQETDRFSVVKEDLSLSINDLPCSFHWEHVEPKHPACWFSPIFSKWWYMVDCDMFSLSANSRVLWHAMHSTNDFKASVSKSDECPGLGSSFNEISPKQNFPNQFHTARSVIVPLPSHHTHYIFFRQSPYHCSLVWTPKTWRICTFSPSNSITSDLLF